MRAGVHTCSPSCVFNSPAVLKQGRSLHADVAAEFGFLKYPISLPSSDMKLSPAASLKFDGLKCGRFDNRDRRVI